MIDINIKDLVKSFEIGNNILDGLTFSVNTGERIGILGRNGCGKTTLFKILTGEYDYDEGVVSVAPGKRIGLISQIPVYPDGWTTEDVLKSAQSGLKKISSRMDEIEDIFSTRQDTENMDALLREYDRLQDDFRRLGGYEADYECNRVANGLDIDRSMRERLFENLSGGEKTRVNLARLILEDTDILLLDEPTNHLDLHATEWLEDYISRFKGTVLAVSHDRYFLDKVAQRCIEISDGKAEFYSGNYSFFVEERQRRFDEKMKQYEKDVAKIEQLTKAAEQMHLWAFMGMDKLHKRAFSMEKRIEKLRHSEKPTEAKKISVKFKQADFRGDEAVILAGLSKAFGEKRIFENFNIEIVGGESVAIIGDNGTGKSTLVKCLVGEEMPDAGYVWLGPQVKAAYLPQIVRFEDDTRSAIDTMLYECKCTPQDARNRLASFGFRGEKVFTPVGVLSGGERSRLKLCILMGSDINLLILDEPTNHLDIASREWIEDALAEYEQTLIFVSHDRYFIDRFATRVVSFDGNAVITDYKGVYKDYTAFREKQQLYLSQQAEAAKAAAKPAAEPAPARRERKPNNEKQINKVEREISRLEEKLAQLEQQSVEFGADYLKLMEIEEQKSEVNGELESLYEKWEELNS